VAEKAGEMKNQRQRERGAAGGDETESDSECPQSRREAMLPEPRRAAPGGRQ
jgi:hypothetical protein